MPDEPKGPLEQQLDTVKENKEKSKGGNGFLWGILAGGVATFVAINLASRWLRSHQKIVMVTPEGTSTENLNEPTSEGFESLDLALE